MRQYHLTQTNKVGQSICWRCCFTICASSKPSGCPALAIILIALADFLLLSEGCSLLALLRIIPLVSVGLRTWQPSKEVPKPQAGKVPRKVLQKVPPPPMGCQGKRRRKCSCSPPPHPKPFFRHFPQHPVWGWHFPKHSSRQFYCPGFDFFTWSPGS